MTTIPGGGEIGGWLQDNGIGLLLAVILALIAFRAVRPLVHRFVVGVVERRASPDSTAAELSAEEATKRVTTIEDLISTLLHGAVAVVAIFVFLSIFDLLPVIAGLSLFLAALTVAGQSIVLDYLMGMLIVIEGPFYKGDWIQIGNVEGEVEEVGLRHTTLRDSSGTVHSVSNGEIRIASNMTRVFARMLVDVTVAYGTDFERATQIVDQVGQTMYSDPEWADRLLEAPKLLRIDAMGELGATLRIAGKVRAADRWSAPGELRKRLLEAFQTNGIQIPVRSGLLVSRDSIPGLGEPAASGGHAAGAGGEVPSTDD